MDETKELLDIDNYLSFDDITSKGIMTKSNCITGNTDHFVDYLREAFKKAKSINISEEKDNRITLQKRWAL